jgi:hypothetical protein
VSQCAATRCTDEATVVVEKDGRYYCRPHGLAEAAKVPTCDVRPMYEECRSCGHPVIWAKTDAGRWMPLDALPVPEIAPRLVVFNPKTKGGHVVTDEDLDRVPRWVELGATLHRSHFASCPNAAQHRGTRTRSGY